MATKKATTETPVVETPKVVTPKELAKELGIDAKRIRAYLRTTEKFGHLVTHAKQTSWQLSPAQAELVRVRFTPSDDDEGEE